MTDQAAMIWKCSVANVRKLTPNTTGSGSEKPTNGASLNIVRLPGDSSREMLSSRCMQAQWLLGQTYRAARSRLHILREVRELNTKLTPVIAHPRHCEEP